MGRDITQTEWQEKREIVFDRDNRKCQECGKAEEDSESLHAHHKLPVSAGGGHEMENLRTLCEFCHNEFHANERRQGTTDDIVDIFNRAEVPVFRPYEIGDRLGCSENQARKKLQRLVKKGFLEKGHRGVWYRSDLPIDPPNISGREYVIAGGSLVRNGEYIGQEEKIIQCEDCEKYYHSDDPERALVSHKSNCPESNK